jgi:hypothetical protein
MQLVKGGAIMLITVSQNATLMACKLPCTSISAFGSCEKFHAFENRQAAEVITVYS